LTARLLDGRAIAAEVWQAVEAEAAKLTARSGVVPHLAILQVGEDPASASYQRQIARSFSARGLEARVTRLSRESGQGAVAEVLQQLGADPAVHGLLLQLPLPGGLASGPLIDALPLGKDVEGLHPYHAGRLASGRPSFVPSTPLGGLELLQRSGITLPGNLAVIVGRSPIVGRPMAALLLQADCTVVVCHTRTPDLAGLTRQADLVVAAAGRPGLVTGAMLRPGAVVVDFGTNEVDGRLVGDVDFESAVEVVAAITPVPGGTGPVTTAVLGRSLVQAARQQLDPAPRRTPMPA
jgi:methylenetetrahydrofolate dehydrogenase (NADP+)/methenyltetrahydrofolate cyclohydrolase